MLELKHIHKYYNAGTVNEMCLFQDFNLTIKDRQFVSVVGSNGSGKTSMLNLICGSIPLDDGQIFIGGKDITKMPEYKRQRRIGRVYQNPAMGTCPSMTILENMSLADNKGKSFNLRPGTSRQRVEFYRESLHSLGRGLRLSGRGVSAPGHPDAGGFGRRKPAGGNHFPCGRAEGEDRPADPCDQGQDRRQPCEDGVLKAADHSAFRSRFLPVSHLAAKNFRNNIDTVSK